MQTERRSLRLVAGGGADDRVCPCGRVAETANRILRPGRAIATSDVRAAARRIAVRGPDGSAFEELVSAELRGLDAVSRSGGQALGAEVERAAGRRRRSGARHLRAVD